MKDKFNYQHLSYSPEHRISFDVDRHSMEHRLAIQKRTSHDHSPAGTAALPGHDGGTKDERCNHTAASCWGHFLC